MLGPTFRRNLSLFEGQFCSLLNLINEVYIPVDGRDCRIWSCSKDATFSVASFYDALNRDDSSTSPISFLWKVKAPPRLLAFTWIALHGPWGYINH